MMNYELAKELKDAGYPQKGDFIWCDLSGYKKLLCRLCLDPMNRRFGSYDELCVAPTLSELIAACGDEFHSLVKFGDSVWRASEHRGSTPEEAVARLWLAIHR